MKKLLAAFVTLIAITMAGVAAWDRGGTYMDKALLVALSVAIVLAVHLLLATSRRPMTWIVWSGCLACAIYGHLTFLTHSSLRAGQERAEQSALTLGTARQIEAIQDALATIQARPITIVTEQLSVTDDRRERAALRAEIAEGKRAQTLRDELIRLSGIATTARVTGTTDPVTARLAEVTGWSESSIMVVIGMTFALLLELIGTVLWCDVLRQETTAILSDEMKTLHTAIKTGHCRPTVADIREFMQCSQKRAMELRRDLVESEA